MADSGRSCPEAAHMHPQALHSLIAPPGGSSSDCAYSQPYIQTPSCAQPQAFVSIAA